MKMQATDREKIFANYICNKGKISTIYNELSRLNSQKNKCCNQKWARDINRQSTEDEIQMSNMHMEKSSMS